MKKRISLLLMFITIVICLTGCGTKLPDLTDDAIAFKTGNFVDSTDGMGYASIEYKDKTYMPYGFVNNKFDKKYIDKCIGYIIQDEDNSSISDPNNKDTRVYTLVDDKDNIFLYVYYVGTTEMNEPEIWRSTDSRVGEINIPKYIESFGYHIWD